MSRGCCIRRVRSERRSGELDAARRHLERLAGAPRPAGSRSEQAAREYCAGTLRELGFRVSEETFEFSAAPGRLATPYCGLASIALLAAAGHLGWRGEAGAALAVLLVGGGVILASAWWLANRGVLALPWLRERAANLVARRGEPRLWLVAHLDSKSQPVPIAVRALGVMASLALWLIAVLASVLQSAGAPLAWIWPALAAGGLVAGLPVAASVVRARSPGALDDASGVATVLLASELVPRHQALGVLLTSAEELGLAGARAWVQTQQLAAAINVDGVDDAGKVRVIHSGRRPDRLVDTLLRAARAHGLRAEGSRLPPGLLVDGVALAAGGWQVVTLSRGSWRTVSRIHTPRDDLSSLTGSGVVEVAGVVQHALGELG